ncbi:hypothetical protein [Fructobacillus tropaeoli]|uniref:hypothetical protein n=1 Tax=Fructobacillus tropaeoli TaxID=709323 RepID=UPI001943D083|nr:hypothetical protein [Fructobacillus tropaeoli]GIC69397.1 hypothetical protein FT12353_00330 [Fructobacillus tropaeoli]
MKKRIGFFFKNLSKVGWLTFISFLVIIGVLIFQTIQNMSQTIALSKQASATPVVHQQISKEKYVDTINQQIRRGNQLANQMIYLAASYGGSKIDNKTALQNHLEPLVKSVLPFMFPNTDNDSGKSYRSDIQSINSSSNYHDGLVSMMLTVQYQNGPNNDQKIVQAVYNPQSDSIVSAAINQTDSGNSGGQS